MKVSGAKKVHYESGPNMTPLVDVVMVILIFLMCTGSFGAATQYLVSNVPVKKEGIGNNSKPPPLDEIQCKVRVNPGVSGQLRGSVGSAEFNSAEEMHDQIFALQKQYAGAGTSMDKIQVIIAPHGALIFQDLINVYQAALQAGFTKVGFAKSHFDMKH